MRRTRIVVAVVPLVLTAVAAPSAVAAPGDPVSKGRPATWSTVATPPMSGDTSQKVYRQVDVVPGGNAFATGYTRHDLPGTSEVRTLVERWDGSSWQTMVTPDVETAPAADYLWGVSGSSASDVWAVGRSATAPGRPTAKPFAIHYDGSAWTKVAVPDPSGGVGADMTAVVTISPTDAWAVGTAYPLEAKGAAYHWDGTSWSAFRLPLFPGCRESNYTELMAITATPSGDVYAGGTCPTASGWGAIVVKMVSLSTWKVVARVPGTSNIADLTSDADGTVWATGSKSAGTGARPFLLSGSGTTWTRQLRPAAPAGTYEQVSGVAVTSTGITMVGETNDNVNQRKPWAATLTPAGRWQEVVIAPQSSVSWLAVVDGSADGPTVALGQYLGDRAKIVGFGAYPS